MNLDKLLRDADAARKPKSIKSVSTPLEASGLSKFGSRLGALLGSSSSPDDNEEDQNCLRDLDRFRVGDYDMSKPDGEQFVGSSYLRMGIPRY